MQNETDLPVASSCQGLNQIRVPQRTRKSGPYAMKERAHGISWVEHEDRAIHRRQLRTIGSIQAGHDGGIGAIVWQREMYLSLKLTSTSSWGPLHEPPSPTVQSSKMSSHKREGNYNSRVCSLGERTTWWPEVSKATSWSFTLTVLPIPLSIATSAHTRFPTPASQSIQF